VIRNAEIKDLENKLLEAYEGCLVAETLEEIPHYCFVITCENILH